MKKLIIAEIAVVILISLVTVGIAQNNIDIEQRQYSIAPPPDLASKPGLVFLVHDMAWLGRDLYLQGGWRWNDRRSARNVISRLRFKGGSRDSLVTIEIKNLDLNQPSSYIAWHNNSLYSARFQNNITNNETWVYRYGDWDQGQKLIGTVEAKLGPILRELTTTRNRLWVTTKSDVSFKAVEPWQTFKAPAGENIRSLAVDNQGNPWIATAELKVYKRIGDEWHNERRNTDIGGGYISIDRYNNVWLMESNSILVLRSGSEDWEVMPILDISQLGSPRSILADSLSNLYIRGDNGLLVLRADDPAETSFFKTNFQTLRHIRYFPEMGIIFFMIKGVFPSGRKALTLGLVEPFGDLPPSQPQVSVGDTTYVDSTTADLEAQINTFDNTSKLNFTELVITTGDTLNYEIDFTLQSGSISPPTISAGDYRIDYEVKGTVVELRFRNIPLPTDRVVEIMAVNPQNLSSTPVRLTIKLDPLTPDGPGTKPETFALHQNFPNPFNPETSIRYELPEQANVKLTIYNLLGQVVQTLEVDELKEAGAYEVVWKGTDDFDNSVTSGVYLYRFQAGGFTETRKMVLSR